MQECCFDLASTQTLGRLANTLPPGTQELVTSALLSPFATRITAFVAAIKPAMVLSSCCDSVHVTATVLNNVTLCSLYACRRHN